MCYCTRTFRSITELICHPTIIPLMQYLAQLSKSKHHYQFIQSISAQDYFYLYRLSCGSKHCTNGKRTALDQKIHKDPKRSKRLMNPFDVHLDLTLPRSRFAANIPVESFRGQWWSYKLQYQKLNNDQILSFRLEQICRFKYYRQASVAHLIHRGQTPHVYLRNQLNYCYAFQMKRDQGISLHIMTTSHLQVKDALTISHAAYAFSFIPLVPKCSSLEVVLSVPPGTVEWKRL